jgi:hypothetical protein
VQESDQSEDEEDNEDSFEEGEEDAVEQVVADGTEAADDSGAVVDDDHDQVRDRRPMLRFVPLTDLRIVLSVIKKFSKLGSLQG